jgi:RNA polymerase sigma-70 factor (ECF subfamily)
MKGGFLVDELLVKRAKKGDKKAFEIIVKLVKDKAYKVAYCYLHNEEDSMDAVCNAIEKAYKNMKKLRKVKYFETWFIRIVINECRLIIREKEKVNKLISNMQSNDLYVENKEAILDLHNALNQLAEEDRIIIYLKYYWGYTIREVATLLELPEGTVKTKIYKNLKKMKIQLEVKEG